MQQGYVVLSSANRCRIVSQLSWYIWHCRNLAQKDRSALQSPYKDEYMKPYCNKQNPVPLYDILTYSEWTYSLK